MNNFKVHVRETLISMAILESSRVETEATSLLFSKLAPRTAPTSHALWDIQKAGQNLYFYKVLIYIPVKLIRVIMMLSKQYAIIIPYVSLKIILKWNWRKNNKKSFAVAVTIANTVCTRQYIDKYLGSCLNAKGSIVWVWGARNAALFINRPA
jgi:hypothetical protein